MLKSDFFLKKTKKGNVVKVIKEHYLRDDIGCSVADCTVCKQSEYNIQAECRIISILDSNIVLHQIDVLEHRAVSNVIILTTVSEEVKHRSIHIYNRLKEMISNPNKHFAVFDNEHHKDTYVERFQEESPNDRNDRAIRVAVKWYAKHLPRKKVILVTNDAGNQEKAEMDGINTQKLEDYVKTFASFHPEIVDIVARIGTGRCNSNNDRKEEEVPAFPRESNEKEVIFAEYWSKAEIEVGIKRGNVYCGPLRINRDDLWEATVPTNGLLQKEILIQGIENLNRGIHGDIVAVELLPSEQWVKISSALLSYDHPEEIPSLNEPLEVTEKSQELTSNNNTTLEKEKEEKETAAVEAAKNRVLSDPDTISTGRVIGIIRTNRRALCGTLEFPEPSPLSKLNSETCGQLVYFIPVSRQIPKICIRTQQQRSQLENMRVVVVIDAWERTCRYPSGHYVKTLGPLGDKNTETEVLLIQHDIPYHPFSEKVLVCLPSKNWTAKMDPDSSSKHRQDLTHLCVFSVDPPGCTDIDDALHIRKLPNGNFEIGVHIADVSHFVQEDTALDKEAAERGTTVYLVDKRIDMLPQLLGENLCSLMEGMDRFSFSVLWEISPTASILSTKFTKAIIRSRASLTYEQAQLKIDDPKQTDEIAVGLRMLNSFAKQFKARRVLNGSLTLASLELKFVRDKETQDPIDIEMYQMRETNSMIEEFMLLANTSVAEKIYEHFPNFALLRRHPSPPRRNFDALLKSIGLKGFSLDVSSSKNLADSLDRAVSKEDPYVNKLIRILTTRCMTQAIYFSSGSVASYVDFHHYGLALPIYTHFTSPIRRYADVVVHRQLACALNIFSLPLKLDNFRVRKIAENINRRHRLAQEGARDSVELHTVLYFRGKTVEEEAYVIRVRVNGFAVLIPKYGMEATVRVYSTDKTNVQYNVAEESLSYIEDDSKTISRIKVLDKVIVELSVDDSSREIRTLCISPPIHKSSISEKSNLNKELQIVSQWKPSGQNGVTHKRVANEEEEQREKIYPSSNSVEYIVQTQIPKKRKSSIGKLLE